MMPLLSPADKRLINSLASRRNDAYIAAAINKPVEVVQAFLAGMKYEHKKATKKVIKEGKAKNKLPKVQVEKMMKSTFRAPKISKRALALQQKEQRNIQQNERERKDLVAAGERRRTASRSAVNRRKFKTIPLDLSGKVSYRLNHKTTVWDLPGASIETLRKKYNIK